MTFQLKVGLDLGYTIWFTFYNDLGITAKITPTFWAPTDKFSLKKWLPFFIFTSHVSAGRACLATNFIVCGLLIPPEKTH